MPRTWRPNLEREFSCLRFEGVKVDEVSFGSLALFGNGLVSGLGLLEAVLSMPLALPKL